MIKVYFYVSLLAEAANCFILTIALIDSNNPKFSFKKMFVFSGVPISRDERVQVGEHQEHSDHHWQVQARPPPIHARVLDTCQVS